MLRDKEKHNIKKSQTNHAGKLTTVDLTALRFVGNKHLGSPGHHSPMGLPLRPVFSIQVKPLSTGMLSTFPKDPENSTAAFAYRFEMGLSLQL